MNLSLFTDPGSNETLRICSIEGQAWFVAADICRIIDLPNPARAVRQHLESEEIMTVDLGEVTIPGGYSHSPKGGGARKMVLVNESGLYGLIFRSRKPEAVRFRLWVTSVVLPAIREHGFYSVFPDGEEADAQKLQARVAGQMSHIRGAVEALREPIPEGYGSLSSLLKSFGMEVDAGQRLRAANAVRNACRAQGVAVIYRWQAKDWRALGYYPREIAKEALLKALPEAEPTPDLFESFDRKEGA